MILKYVRTFLLVADTHSFLKAGKELYLSATAVSQQISALENEIGVKLIDRSNKGVELTEAGRVFLGEARRIERVVNEAIEKTRRESERSKDQLSVGVISSEIHRIIPLVNASFAHTHPDVRIHYIQTSHLSREADIRNGVIDLAFTFGRDRADSEQMLHEVVLEDNPACVIPRDNSLSQKKTVAIEDLRDQHIFIVEESASFFHDRMREYIRKNEPSIQVESVTEGMALVQSLLKTRACPYICPRMNTLKDGNFAVRPFTSFGTINIGIVYGSNNPLICEYIRTAKEILQREAIQWRWEE